MKSKVLFFYLLITILVGVAILLVLYYASEAVMQKQNPFLRSFPPHVTEYVKQTDLKFNSYYFAGYDNGVLYLGNYTAPLHAIAIDSTFKNKQEINIIPQKSNFQFRSVQLRVAAPNFYLMDGTVPCIYSGSITDWKAKLRLKRNPYFTFAEPIDSITFAFRGNRSDSGANILGTFKLTTPPLVSLSPKLLQKQAGGDGIFDTDGTLLYSKGLSSIVYVYRYRNQFVVADKSANLVYRGNTIDTVSRAQIKVAQLEGERKMSAPPLSVNTASAVCNTLLFVNSTLRGKFDNLKAWQSASTIDVYNLKKNVYLFSFYIAGIDGDKLKSLLVTPTHLYALIDTQLVSYAFKGNLKKEIMQFSGDFSASH
jgi:hypothetical protein